MTRQILHGLAAVCLALPFIGCSGGLQADKRAATQRIEAYISTQPKLDPDTVGEMRAYRLRNGMTEAEVRATWGAPEDVLKLSDDVVEWRFSCDFPHLCRSRPAAGPTVRTIKPNAFFVKGRLDRWNP